MHRHKRELVRIRRVDAREENRSRTQDEERLLHRRGRRIVVVARLGGRDRHLPRLQDRDRVPRNAGHAAVRAAEAHAQPAGGRGSQVEGRIPHILVRQGPKGDRLACLVDRSRKTGRLGQAVVARLSAAQGAGRRHHDSRTRGGRGKRTRSRKGHGVAGDHAGEGSGDRRRGCAVIVLGRHRRIRDCQGHGRDVSRDRRIRQAVVGAGGAVTRDGHHLACAHVRIGKGCGGGSRHAEALIIHQPAEAGSPGRAGRRGAVIDLVHPGKTRDRQCLGRHGAGADRHILGGRPAAAHRHVTGVRPRRGRRRQPHIDRCAGDRAACRTQVQAGAVATAGAGGNFKAGGSAHREITTQEAARDREAGRSGGRAVGRAAAGERSDHRDRGIGRHRQVTRHIADAVV